MSEESSHKENDGKGSLLTWVGVVGVFAIAFAVLALSNFYSRAKTSVDAELIQKRQALLKENNAKAYQLITEPGKNGDGTFRIPVKDAVQVLLRDGKSLHMVEESARKQTAQAQAPAAAPEPAKPASDATKPAATDAAKPAAKPEEKKADTPATPETKPAAK
ncbi:MAG: hypothetical protein LBV12_04430 [Puniceicoccales bacterium]|jgi:hypothetical protein|nr:hypothetical protein [Puniceicoccales bacterium]